MAALRWTLLWRAAALVLLGAACGPGRRGAQAPPSAATPLLGQPMPSFERETLSGARLDTAALVGHIVVVKFFADYCEPCKVTLPEAQALAKRRDDVVFVGVGEDDSEGLVRDVVAHYGLSFPVIHDRGQVLAGRFRVSYMPATFVIDGHGVVRWAGGPGQRPGDLDRAIDRLARE